MRSRLVAGVAVIAALAAVFVPVPAVEATFVGRDGHLLWFLNPAGDWPSLWLTEPNGQRARRLPIRPRCGVQNASALFTRTGQQLIFQKFVDCNFDEFAVELVNVNGTRARTLATFSSFPRPNVLDMLPGSLAISPDGRMLAYGFAETGHVRPSYKVVFINVQTAKKAHPISVPGAVAGPMWLSAHTLLFLLGSGVVETTHPNGSHARRINIALPGATLESQITIQGVVSSPDGSRLAIAGGTPADACGRGGEPPCTSDLYVVGVKGGRAKRLTHSGDAGAPVWSPDGRKIAFHDGAINKLVTVATDHIMTLVTRIPLGGLGVVDWQAVQ